MTTGTFLSGSDIWVNRAADMDQILLREAEAEVWAQLSRDLCQAKVAAAKARAIRARLAARPL